MKKGVATAEIDIAVNVGEFPVSSPRAGIWAVQVLMAPFESEMDATAFSNRVTAALRRVILGEVLVVDNLTHPAPARTQ